MLNKDAPNYRGVNAFRYALLKRGTKSGGRMNDTIQRYCFWLLRRMSKNPKVNSMSIKKARWYCICGTFVNAKIGKETQLCQVARFMHAQICSF
jgi:hypothetical protein